MSIEDRINAFKWIRDIPYKIGLSSKDCDYCCSSKAVYLERILAGLGLKSRHIICQFDWSETPLPKNILNIPKDDCEVTHQYIEVYIPESQKWIVCDPTWDEPLTKAGFDIAEWDGINNTKYAVKPIKLYSPEESADLIKEYGNPEVIERHLEKSFEFYNAINIWMKSFR